MSAFTIDEVLEANEEVLSGLNSLLPQLSASAPALDLNRLQVGSTRFNQKMKLKARWSSSSFMVKLS